jgi:hypothetical protein
LHNASSAGKQNFGTAGLVHGFLMLQKLEIGSPHTFLQQGLQTGLNIHPPSDIRKTPALPIFLPGN